MMKIRFRLREEIVYRLICTVVFIGISLFGAGRFLGIADLGTVHFLTVLCVLAVAAVIQEFKEKGRILFLLFLAGLLVITAMTFGIRNCVDFFQAYFQWLAGGEQWTQEWRLGYEVIQTVIVVMFCYFLQLIQEKYILIKYVLACLLIGVLLFCLLTKNSLPHSGVVFVICYLLLIYIEWRQFNWNKVKRRDSRAHMFWIMPFIVIYFLLMLYMPAPKEPYDWKFVKTAYRQVREVVLALTQKFPWNTGDGYDTVLIGFSEDGEFHEDVHEDKREVMTIQRLGGFKGNVYLTGRIYDIFDGRQWRQENHDTVPEGYLDTIETLYAVRRLDRQSSWDYMRKTTLRIQYRRLRTSYLFAPAKTEAVRAKKRISSFSWDGGSMLSNGRLGYGAEYEVDYYQINVGSEEWNRLLTVTQPSNLDVLEEILQNAEKKNVAVYNEEDLLVHRKKIDDIYSEEVTLSKEVQNYLDEITASASNDLEKMQMIEEELSSFTYTQSPGALPDTVTDASEFLDYFLMESRQGYCTHFATAFTLLARAEGLPARYVQGFCVPMEGEEETVVYSNMAHSWSEVYLYDVGWIPFEPTPGYGKIRYSSWKTSQNAQDAFSRPNDYYRPDYADTLEAASLEDSSGADDIQEVKSTGYIVAVLRIVISTVLAVLSAGFFMVALENMLRKRRYRRMSPTEKFREEALFNLRILSWLGLRRESVETLQELKERAELTLRFEGISLQFIEDYEAILYGEKTVGEKAIAAAGLEREQLLRSLRAKKKWRYFYYLLRLKGWR